MSIDLIDSDIIGGLFARPDMRAVFESDAPLQRMFDVEAAMARHRGN